MTILLNGESCAWPGVAPLDRLLADWGMSNRGLRWR